MFSKTLSHLLLLNGAVIACFFLLNHYYYDIQAYIESLSLSTKLLDEKQKRVLKKYFPFYNKLSPALKRRFEQKLLFFYHMKAYSGVAELVVLDRMKLFISAYAAQVSLGFKDFGFSHIYHVKIYPFRFYSSSKQQLVSWELDEDGVLHLSWKDFFWQLRKEVVLPLGLEIMAFAFKKGESTIKEDIYNTRSLLYHHSSPVKPEMAGTPLFRTEDFLTKEDFLEACIKNYFGHPTELRNNHPNLYRSIDTLLYKEV